MQDLGLQWLLDKGRVASEEGYPYQGVNNFCTAKGRDHIKFSVSVGTFLALLNLKAVVMHCAVVGFVLCWLALHCHAVRCKRYVRQKIRSVYSPVFSCQGVCHASLGLRA